MNEKRDEWSVEARMDIGDRTVFLGEVVDGDSKSSDRPLMLQKLLSLATPEQKRTLKEQMAADAALDIQAIRRWREAG